MRAFWVAAFLIAACGGTAIVDGELMGAGGGGTGTGANTSGNGVGGTTTATDQSATTTTSSSAMSSTGSGFILCTTAEDCCDQACDLIETLPCSGMELCDCIVPTDLANCEQAWIGLLQCVIEEFPDVLSCEAGGPLLVCGPCDDQIGDVVTTCQTSLDCIP